MSSNERMPIREGFLAIFSQSRKLAEGGDGSPACGMVADTMKARDEFMTALSDDERTLAADLSHHARKTVKALLVEMAHREREQADSPTVGRFHTRQPQSGRAMTAMAVMMFAALAVSLLTKEDLDGETVDVFGDLLEVVRLFRGEEGAPRHDEDTVLLRAVFEGAFAGALAQAKEAEGKEAAA